MKAELTRNIIDKHVPKTLFKGKSENFELYHVYAELDRLEYEAKVGRACIKAFENGARVEGSHLECYTLIDLFDWAESEV